ncbi:MAG TPA: hypothetical protein VFS21_19835 [Roseiflexaceae bacterium]|nr:hypothetical protein [Roseiflexaceae bacterium]
MSLKQQPSPQPGIHLVSVAGYAAEREKAVLRLLGRLGVARLTDVWQLVLLGLARRTVQDLLQRLVQRGMIWTVPGPSAPTVRADGRLGPPRPVRVFGLTPAGHALIDRLGLEPDGHQKDWLIARERRGSSEGGRSKGKGKRSGRAADPADLDLPQELLTATWCASILDHARRTPQCVGMQCYTQVVTARDGTTPLQTLNAYVLLAFDPQQHTLERNPWELPWLDDAPAAHLRIVRLALLTDIGTMALPTLIRELRVFPWLAAQGGYRALFGDVPRPVVLTVPGDRAGQVFLACRDSLTVDEAPPEQRVRLEAATRSTLGQLVVASTDKAEHPVHGALWGGYTQMNGQRTHLLAGVFPGLEQWVMQVAGWRPEVRADRQIGPR